MSRSKDEIAAAIAAAWPFMNTLRHILIVDAAPISSPTEFISTP